MVITIILVIAIALLKPISGKSTSQMIECSIPLLKIELYANNITFSGIIVIVLVPWGTRRDK